MLGVYLSGTGNTRHCVEKLLGIISPEGKAIPIEDKDVRDFIIANDEILLAYPTQFSNVPYMVKDFINKNSDIWAGKKVLCLTTMGAFSGDGTGCSARLFKKYGAEILGGLQIKMPDSVCDSKLLKKTLEDNKRIVKTADSKLEHAGREIRNLGRYPKEGLSFFAHIAGLFGQRLWFYGKTADFSTKLKVSDACIGCAKCVASCPMQNLEIINGKAVPKGKCTMCYRCISTCPKRAITLLGKEVTEQCRFEKYEG